MLKIIHLLLISNEFTGAKRYWMTGYGQTCSEVGYDDILRNECYEAAKITGWGEFEEMTPPNPEGQDGCFYMGTSILEKPMVFWNIGKKGMTHRAAMAICKPPNGITTTRPNRKLSSTQC